MGRFSEVCHTASGPPPQLVPPDHLRQMVHVAVDDPPGPTIASMDGPLCRKWSPCRKPAYGGYKSWLATLFDNNTMHGRLLQ